MNTKSALYIGIYTEGTTSKMRADALKTLLPGWNVRIIDTDIPFKRAGRMVRTIGFRYKTGPLIASVNRFIQAETGDGQYGLIWVDKAIYLTPATTEQLKKQTAKLVHYTPDAAFLSNASRLFNRSIPFYDYLISTKSFELGMYEARTAKERILFATQGYDKQVHKPLLAFADKQDQVAFIGLCEPHREAVLQQLLDKNINVALAGKKWNAFVEKNKHRTNLRYKGEDIRGAEYTRLISSSYFSLGLLSKRFPELHTTRTFEIPACGTALLTEKNMETETFYSAGEVIFYSGTDELIKQVQYYSAHPDALQQLTEKGLHKVQQAGYDYHSILRSLLAKIVTT